MAVGTSKINYDARTNAYYTLTLMYLLTKYTVFLR